MTDITVTKPTKFVTVGTTTSTGGSQPPGFWDVVTDIEVCHRSPFDDRTSSSPLVIGQIDARLTYYNGSHGVNTSFTGRYTIEFVVEDDGTPERLNSPRAFRGDMGMTSGMYSSTRDDWETPQWLFDELDREFHFDVDVCASGQNAKCGIYYSKWMDALNLHWRGVCWMNPPYGRQISKWVKKAYEESQKGATIVCLLPARTDTAWFHDYCLKGEIRLVRGRLRFPPSNKPAPMPSMIVIFRKDNMDAGRLTHIYDSRGKEPSRTIRPESRTP